MNDTHVEFELSNEMKEFLYQSHIRRKEIKAMDSNENNDHIDEKEQEKIKDNEYIELYGEENYEKIKFKEIKLENDFQETLTSFKIVDFPSTNTAT